MIIADFDVFAILRDENIGAGKKLAVRWRRRFLYGRMRDALRLHAFCPAFLRTDRLTTLWLDFSNNNFWPVCEIFFLPLKA